MTTPREQLIARLRDPGTKQTKGYLRVGDCFCFDGILCDVFDPNGWRPHDQGGDIDPEAMEYEYCDTRSIAFINEEIRQAFGIKPAYALADLMPHIPEHLGNELLDRGISSIHTFRLNDNGLSFPEFADLLEKGIL